MSMEHWHNNTDGRNLQHRHSCTKNLTWIGPGSNL